MFWVVCYDIPNDKRRAKVMKTLEGFGRRAQYSVFECDLSDDKLARLERLIRRVINDDEDDVRFYPLNQTDIPKIRLLGKAELRRSHPAYMI